MVSRLKLVNAPMIGALENNDAKETLLETKFKELGTDISCNFVFENIDGLRMGMLHKHEKDLTLSLIELETFDVLVYGHTHKAKTYRKGKTLVINPGERCGYPSKKSTIVLLDTRNLNAEIVQLET